VKDCEQHCTATMKTKTLPWSLALSMVSIFLLSLHKFLFFNKSKYLYIFVFTL
jgi:hypothetical protein